IGEHVPPHDLDVLPRHRPRSISRRTAAFSLKRTRLSREVTFLWSEVFSCCSQLVVEVCSFLFRRSRRRSFLGAAPAAQFHAGPRAVRKQRELAGAVFSPP